MVPVDLIGESVCSAEARKVMEKGVYFRTQSMTSLPNIMQSSAYQVVVIPPGGLGEFRDVNKQR